MKIDYNLSDAEAPTLYDPGVYLAVMDKFEYVPSSKSSGQPMFALEWRFLEGEYASKVLKYDNVSLSPKAAFRHDAFLEALGIERTCTGCGHTFTQAGQDEKKNLICPSCNQRTAVSYDIGEDPIGSAMLGRQVKIVVKHEKDNKGQDRARVDKYLPASWQPQS